MTRPSLGVTAVAEQKMNFYRSFWDMSNVLPAAGRRRFVTAVVDYFFTGEEPSGLTSKEAALFSGIRGRVDASRSGAEFARRRYEGAAKAPGVGAFAVRQAVGNGHPNNGTQRGSQRGTQAETHATEGEIKRGREGAGVRAHADHAEPDRGEVVAWFEANGHGMPTARLREEAEAFYDHFSAQGWVTGAGVPISRWQAKAAAWLRRAAESSTGERGRVPGRRVAPQAPACDFSAYSAAPSEVVSRG